MELVEANDRGLIKLLLNVKKYKNKFRDKTAVLVFLLLLILIGFPEAACAQLIVYNSGVATTIQSGLTVTIKGGFTNQVQAATNGSVDNQGTITVSEGWSNTAGNAVFSTAAGLVTFNGTASQTIGGSATTNFYNLTLANTYATIPQFILGVNTNIRNTLTMTSGKVNLATYTLTLGTAAATPGSLSYTSGWLYGGTFTRWINTPTIAIGNASGHFPMGSSTDYRPFWVGSSSVLTTGGTLSLVHTPILHSTSVNFADASWGNNVIYVSKSYWTVSTNSIAAAGSPFSLRAEGTGLGPIAAVSDLNLTLSNGVVGTHAASAGTTSNPQVNRTGLTLNQLNNTGTSQNFYVGSKSTNSPLPVELLSFNASLNTAKVVDLSWITASETNNDFFTVEKTMEGSVYEEVIKVKGAGNSTEKRVYVAKDYTPYKNKSYYRLKQTDFNGDYSYSQLVAIENKETGTLKVFPNPLDQGNLFVSLQHAGTSEITIVMYDVLGKKCFSKTLMSADDNFFTALEFVPFLNPGLYLLTITTPQQLYKEQVVIE
jgi:hypothetical protein